MEMFEETEEILEGILRYCKPQKVVLYGEKHVACSNQLKSVDICVILSEVNKPELLRKLYLNIDAPIPFQVLLYTCDEWDDLTQDASSYASVIAGRGTVLYEQKS